MDSSPLDKRFENRQHAFVFDIENRKVGIAHATCSHNPHQVMNIMDLASEG